MDAAVVHQVGLDHRVAVGLENLGHRIAQQIVADMAQVKRLVRIGRRVLDHDRPTRRRRLAVVLVRGKIRKATLPERRIQHQIQEALDDVTGADLRHVGRHVLADLLRRGLRRFPAPAQQRKRDQRIVALELPPRLLKLQLLVAQRTVQRLDRPPNRFRKITFNIHFSVRF